MKKAILPILIVMLIILYSCTSRQENAKRIDLEDLRSFLETRHYAQAVYDDATSKKEEFPIYYVGNRGVNREAMESSTQISSQKVMVFTFPEGTSVYLLIGKILGDVYIPEDMIIDYFQSTTNPKETYMANTVYAFSNIIISKVVNNRGNAMSSADRDAVINFDVELADYIKQYLDEQ